MEIKNKTDLTQSKIDFNNKNLNNLINSFPRDKLYLIYSLIVLRGRE